MNSNFNMNFYFIYCKCRFHSWLYFIYTCVKKKFQTVNMWNISMKKSCVEKHNLPIFNILLSVIVCNFNYNYILDMNKNIFLFCTLQICVRRLQRTFMAGCRCKYQGQTLLLTSPRSGANETVSYSGSSCLTHNICWYSSTCEYFSYTNYYFVTWGFTSATDIICSTFIVVLTKEII